MLLSKEELEKSAQPDPQVAEFYAKNPQPDDDLADPLVVRSGLNAYTSFVLAQLGDPPHGQSETYHDIEMRDGFSSRLKIFKRLDGPPGPLFVLCFGGGFIAGTCDQLSETGRTLVRLFGATVVNISYRVAPEYKFPFAQLDAWDSMKWIADNATGSLLNADPSKGFVMGGVSAGGSITAALSRKFQEEPLAHPLTGLWLCIPSVMYPGAVPEKYKHLYCAMDQNSEAPGLRKKLRDAMRDAAQWDITSDLRYAVNSKTAIAKQPRSYFQVDGMDPLRDDGLIYDEMLKEAGVETKIDFYPGCPHAHWSRMRGYEIGDRACIDAAVGMGWLLRQELSRADAAKVLDIAM